MSTPRATWKGHLKLALVSCPIRLYRATGRAERISSHFLHRDTLNRIQMIPHDPSLGKVARSDLISGYEYDRGRRPINMASKGRRSLAGSAIEAYPDTDRWRKSGPRGPDRRRPCG